MVALSVSRVPMRTLGEWCCWNRVWGVVMSPVVQGEVIRFDQVKGYGFISPTSGGEDVFLHVNDLLGEKFLIRPGAVVEFILEPGERGPKASSVRVVRPAPGQESSGSGSFSNSGGGRRESAAASGESRSWTSGATAADSDGEFVDVVSATEFTREVTEILLTVEPSLTGAQILAVRRALSSLGVNYGWVAS